MVELFQKTWPNDRTESGRNNSISGVGFGCCLQPRYDDWFRERLQETPELHGARTYGELTKSVTKKLCFDGFFKSDQKRRKL